MLALSRRKELQALRDIRNPQHRYLQEQPIYLHTRIILQTLSEVFEKENFQRDPSKGKELNAFGCV